MAVFGYVAHDARYSVRIRYPDRETRDRVRAMQAAVSGSEYTGNYFMFWTHAVEGERSVVFDFSDLAAATAFKLRWA